MPSATALTTCAAVLCLTGCGVKTTVDPGDAGVLADGGIEPLVEVGTGIDSFLPLTDGQDVNIIFGPQGGYHVWTALRASRRLEQARVQVTVLLKTDGGELSHNGYQLTLVDTGTHYEWYAMQALVPDPAAIDGQPVSLRVELTDANGQSAFDERRIIPHRP